MAKKYPEGANPAVTFGIGKTFHARPQLFAFGMAVIAEHSEAESYLSLIMMSLLGTNPAPGAAIFSVIRANHLQTEAVLKVASVVLEPEGVAKLKDCLNVFDASAKKRNDLAHRMWGLDESIDDAVVLLKTDQPASFQVNIVKAAVLESDDLREEHGNAAVDKMHKGFEIWTKSDFEDALELATKAKGKMLDFLEEVTPTIIGKAGDKKIGIQTNPKKGPDDPVT